MTDPYRIQGKVEPEPPVKKEPNWIMRNAPELKIAFFAVICCALLLWVFVTESAKSKSREHTCQVERRDGESHFAVTRYGDSGSKFDGIAEGFFTTRREAEAYLATIPQCVKK